MKYRKLPAKVGDTLKINDSMSLRFEKHAPDVAPVWHEIPSIDGYKKFEEGTFVEVTGDIWFIYDHGRWRTMTPPEHIEADRQLYLDSLSGS